MANSTVMATRNFMDLVQARWNAGRTISVGLDPEPARLPANVRNLPLDDGIVAFLGEVIEATADLAAAYKPNAAFFEALGNSGTEILERVIAIVHEVAPDVPVILDAKRADIGNTNEKYATAVFDFLECDAVTVHPYLGPEAMQPFLDRKDKGIIVLARTSNPGSGRYQDLSVNGRPLYQHIAQDVADHWNGNGNCGLVVGATYPEEMKAVREVAPGVLILVPGLGAQGGDVAATVQNGMDANGNGLLLHAGRSILYAFENGKPTDEASAAAIKELHDEITAARP